MTDVHGHHYLHGLDLMEVLTSISFLIRTYLHDLRQKVVGTQSKKKISEHPFTFSEA